MVLETIGLSTLVVAASEIGDKTQLLALCLAARYRAPAPIVLGILAATITNHVLAAALGVSVASILSPEVLRWVLIVSFVLMGFWMLVPDKMDDDKCDVGKAQRYGVFGATFVLFFLAEMGDKTQVATIALAAHYGSVIAVVCGTTLGMLIADVPAVFIGDKLSQKISMKLMRWIAAVIFFGLAVAAYFADAPALPAAAS
jgi:putative Ca2+/H+ antiporter (TMEM165/GDT1 family)